MSKRIAFCGTRGVPGNYGGFETAVDEISRRFVAAGYEVEVFCRRSSHAQILDEHAGRKLVYVDGSARRSLDTFVSAIQTGRHLVRHRRRYDYVFWFNNANLPGILISLLAGTQLSVNTDGLEWRRGKWSWPFKLYYLLASLLVARLCRNTISDSIALQHYYKTHFFKSTHFIPYGSPALLDLDESAVAAVLDRYGVSRDRYFLQVTRIEPDNLPLEAARAFIASGLGHKGYHFVIIGLKDSTPYAEELRALSGQAGIVVAPAEYTSETLQALRQHCVSYVHGNSVGGTNPALLEAMTICPRVLAIEGPFSREVLGDSGFYFDVSTLADRFKDVIAEAERTDQLQTRVKTTYDWDAVARSYMALAEGGLPDYMADLLAPHSQPASIPQSMETASTVSPQ